MRQDPYPVAVSGRPGIALDFIASFAEDPMGEQERRAVLRDGSRVGEIVYLRRNHPQGGSAYGWRPAGYLRGGLLSMHNAVDEVLRRSEQVKG